MNDLALTANVFDRIANPLEAVTLFGEFIAASNMFGCDNEAQGRVFALACLCERKNPLEIAKTYHLIKGRLTMRADAMLAGFRAAGGRVKWIETTATNCRALWIYDGNEIEIGFSIEDAKRAELIKSGGGWTKFPDAMLRARCISKAVRMLAPEIVCGTYTPEEAADFDTPPDRAIISATVDARTVEVRAAAIAAKADDPRAELMRAAAIFAKANGPDKTREIIETIGGAPRIAEVPEEKMPALLAALKGE